MSTEPFWTDERCCALMNSIQDGMLVLVQDAIVFANDSFVRMSGRDRDTVLAQSIEDLVTAGDVASLRSCLAGRKPCDGPCRGCEMTLFPANDDRPIPLLATVSTPEDTGDGVVLALLRDITRIKETERALRESRDTVERQIAERTEQLRREVEERKQAELALRHSEERFRTLVESTSDWVWEVDAQARYVYASPKVEDILGYEPSELVGRTPFELMPPDEAERVHAAFDRIAAARAPIVQLENRNVAKDGREVVLETSGVPILDEAGDVVGYRGVDRDITQRKGAARALAESEERWRTLVENMPEAVMVHDARTILLVNDNALKLFGAERRVDFVGRSPLDIIHPDERGAAWDRMQACLRTGESFSPTERRMVRLDGTAFESEVAGTRTYLDGRPVIEVIISDITERKRRERELAESEARYRSVVEDQTELICRYDADFRRLFVNDAYCRYYGKSRDELVGEPWGSWIPDGDAARVREAIRSLGPDNTCHEFVHRVVVPDGSVRWLEWSNRALLDDDGNLLEYQAVGRDITQRIELETALRESEERYALAITGANEAIWDCSTQRDTLYVSPRLRELFGTDAEKISRPDDWLPLIHPDDRGRYRRALTAHLKGESDIFDCEYRLVTADGSIRWVHHRGTALHDGDGRAYRMAGSIGDITERKRIEEHERRHRDTLDLLNSIAAVANEATSATDALQTCLKRICERESWPIGHVYVRDPENPNTFMPSDLWYLEDPEAFAEWDRVTRTMSFDVEVGLPGRAAARRQPVLIADVSHEDWFFRADVARRLGIRAGFALPIVVGDEIPVILEFFCTEIIAPDAALYRTLAHVGAQIARVFERERVARDMDTARRLAEEANKAKSDFLAAMSHELRTPLNAIIGLSDAIRHGIYGGLGNEKYSEYIEHINESGIHLLDLINEILDISAVEAGKLELHEEPTDIGETVDAVVRLLQLRAEKKAIGIAVAPMEAAPRLMTDARRLKQVLLNLVTNAVKYTEENGAIAIAATCNEDGGVALTIADTGIGMDEATLKKALAWFGQADNIMTRRQEGSGLGLPLSRRLMAMMGGDFAIESTPAVGTTVTLTFPPDKVIGPAADA